VHFAHFVLISQLSFSLIIVSNLVASSAAMSWCCLLAHGERKLVRVVSIFPEAGERVRRSIRAVSVEKESFRDGFVVDWYVPGRVSGCCGWYLSFTASAATYTRFHVKMCALSLAVASYMPYDDNSHHHFCEYTFTLVRTSHML
jgi:hypothetical protein